MDEYVNQRELATRLGVSRRLIALRWAGPGGIFNPDVQIGKVMGWAPARIQAFGVAAGLLTSRGLVIPRAQHGRVLDPSGEWRVPTRVLLGQADVARLWGRSVMEIVRVRNVGRFPEAVARIGDGARDVYGWEPEQIVTYGKQTGRLDINGKAVPAVRTRPA